MDVTELKDAMTRVVVTNKSTGRVFEPGKASIKGRDDLQDLARELYDGGQCIACMDVVTILLGVDGAWCIIDECNNVAIINNDTYAIEITSP